MRSDLRGRETLIAQGAERECVVSLSEAAALLVAQQVAVEVLRSGHAERSLQQYLTRGGFEQITAAHDFSDVHGSIVDNAGELIAGEIVFAPDEEVSEVLAGGEGLPAGMEIVEGNGLAVGDAEAVVRGIRVQSPGARLRRAAAVVVKRLVVFLVRRLGGLCKVFARAGARVSVAGSDELFEGYTVERNPL